MSTRGQSRWRAMPFDEWPDRDHAAWQAATQKLGILDKGGRSSAFAKDTLDGMRSVYGGLLGWLAAKGWLDRDAGPDERLTVDRFVAYVAARRATSSVNTVFNSVGMLVMTLNCLAPGKDWSWLRQHPCVPTRREALDARKAIRPVPVGVLLAGLLNRLEALADAEPTLATAVRYRDLLLVSVCACTNLRLRNLIGLTIGRSIRRHGNCYSILEPSASLKNKAVVAIMVMPELTPFLDCYIAQHRRFLLGSSESDTLDRLWLTPKGRWMDDQAAHKAFKKVTTEILGWSANPHSFRHSAVTLMMSDDPRSPEVSAALLAHYDLSTTETYYDLSIDEAAGEVWRTIIEPYRRPWSHQGKDNKRRKG